MPLPGPACLANDIAERWFATASQFPGGEISPPGAPRGMNVIENTPLRFAGLPRRRHGNLEVPIARRPIARLLGLAFLDRRRAWPGLFIPRCNSIHSFGMRFPLRVEFLDRHGRPLKTIERMPPWRVHRCAGAEAVLELVSCEEGE